MLGNWGLGMGYGGIRRELEGVGGGLRNRGSLVWNEIVKRKKCKNGLGGCGERGLVCEKRLLVIYCGFWEVLLGF